MKPCRRTEFSGEIGQAAACDHIDLSALLCELANSNCDGRIAKAGYEPDLIDIEPSPSDATANIRLVLMVSVQNLDRPSEYLPAEIRNGHFSRKY